MQHTNTKEETFIDTRSAALASGLHADYIARLARQNRVRGKRIGNKWHIDPVSLTEFVEVQTHKEAERQDELKQRRKKEYRLSQEQQRIKKKGLQGGIQAPDEAYHHSESLPIPAAQAHNVALQAIGGLHSMTPGLATHVISPVLHPGIEFVHKLTALLASIVLIFGAYSSVDAQFRSFACISIIEASGAFFEAGKMVFKGNIDNPKAFSSQVAAAAVSFADLRKNICTGTF